MHGCRCTGVRVMKVWFGGSFEFRVSRKPLDIQPSRHQHFGFLRGAIVSSNPCSSSTGSTMTEASSFESFIVTNAPEQRTFFPDGKQVQVPCVLTPPAETLTTPTDASHFVQTHRKAIDNALQQSGVVLFRGFPLQNAQDFDSFVCAFSDWQDLSYERSMSFAVRTKLSNRICTTNEGKSGGLVFHHEQAQTPLWPSHVFFCCLLPAKPGDGGGTGLVSSVLVLNELRRQCPDFVRKCEEHGVRYTVYAGPNQDPSKGAGRSWKSFFHAESKEECERKMKAGGWEWEWGVGPDRNVPVGPEFLKCTTPVLEAVKLVPGTDQKCFFNQLIATTANALEFSKVGIDGGGYDPLKDIPTQEGIDACVRFGNGESVPLEVLLKAKAICEELAVDVSWQKGDVALISNYLMMHARRPWNGAEGTRKLLASLVAEENCTSFGKELVAM